MIETKEVRNKILNWLDESFTAKEASVENFPKDLNSYILSHPRMHIFVRVDSKTGTTPEVSGQQNLYIGLEVTIYMKDHMTQDEQDDARDKIIETVTSYMPLGYEYFYLTDDSTLFNKNGWWVYGQRYQLETLNFPGAA